MPETSSQTRHIIRAFITWQQPVIARFTVDYFAQLSYSYREGGKVLIHCFPHIVYPERFMPENPCMIARAE